ncbi:MAG: 6-hydroxymethylpterin diphosphokinase MptE-like protein [Campylobacter sp.]
MSKNSVKKTQATVNEIQNPILANNLRALFQQDEILAAEIFSVASQQKYEVFIGKDPIDINIIDKNSYKYMYEHPAKDIESMVEDIQNKYARHPSLFFYGLGNGVFYKAILKNATHKKIIVVEPDLEIIYIVLNLIDLSQELLSERLVLFYSKLATYTQFYYLITKCDLSNYAKLYELIIHSKFYDDFSEDYIRINQDIIRGFTHMAMSHGNSIDDTLIGIRQHIENLPHMLTNYCYRSLVRKRYKMLDTAVIVSSGPSLDKQIQTLKKYAPYVSVISVDGSFPILAKHGIKPDYVTSIERMEPTSNFFNEKFPGIDEDAYFIVASVTHKDTVSKILPRRLTLTMRPQLEERHYGLDDYGYLGIGHSCANQAYQLAYALGHKNIVLIGQDLAFGKDGRSHAKGHAVPQPSENLYTLAYGGEGQARTTYVWLAFKNQFENDIEEAKKENLTTFNCTEGGARINGAIERPFLDVMKELCAGKEPKNLPHIPKDSDTRANKNLLKAYNSVQTKIKVEQETKDKIESLFLEIVPTIDELLAQKRNGQENEKMFPRLLKIVKKIDKLKDFISMPRRAKRIEYMFQMSVFYQELELAKIAVAPSGTTMQKVDKLLEWVEMHKYWLFSAAGGFDADIETSKDALKPLIQEMKKRGIFPKEDK